MSPRIMGVVLGAAASLGLGACTTYDDYGYPSTHVSVGVGYGSPYYGWYDDYYYPGTGYYVYDRYGSRYRWSNYHRDYWYARRAGHRDYRENWSGYERYRDRRHGDYRDQRRWRDGDERRYRDHDGNRDQRRYRERDQRRGDARGNRDARPDPRAAPRAAPRAERPAPRVERRDERVRDPGDTRRGGERQPNPRRDESPASIPDTI